MPSSAEAEGAVLSDAELITAARSGDSRAFGELYERHAGAAWAVAREYTNTAADAEDVVADAFTKVWTIVSGGGGPDIAFRAYVFTVVRRLGMLRVQGGRRVVPTDDLAKFEAAFGGQESTDNPALADFERGVVARAFRTLPERWQAALWYTEVESLTPAQIAPLLGLSANGVAALAYRAREGLREAYLQQHLHEPLDAGCRAVAGKLGAYVRGGLAKRETEQVDAHLETCGRCRALLLELGDVNHGMRGIIAPLVLGVLGLGALAHPLPVGGGLAAGIAALGQGAGVATGTGAGGVAAGGNAAGGAGGAAGGVGGAVGTGAVAAVGSGAAAVTTGGVAAFVGAMPLWIVLAAAAVAVAGVLGVFSSGGPAGAAPPAVSAMSARSPDQASAGPSDTPSSPTPTPTPTPTTPTPTPTPAPTDVPTGVPTVKATVVPVPVPVPVALPPSTTSLPSLPSASTFPSAAPSTEAPVSAARLTLSTPAAVVLVAETAHGGPPVSRGLLHLALSNAGEQAATSATVTLRLPVRVHADVASASSPWVCTTSTTSRDGDTVTCTRPLLGGSAHTDLDVDLYAEVDAISNPSAQFIHVALSPDPPRVSQDLRVGLEIRTLGRSGG